MKKGEEETTENQPDISKFLLEETVSLRNEINFTELIDMVNPLTFSYDLKKHPNMNLIPIMYKVDSEELKKLFFEIYE